MGVTYRAGAQWPRWFIASLRRGGLAGKSKQNDEAAFAKHNICQNATTWNVCIADVAVHGAFILSFFVPYMFFLNFVRSLCVPP